MYIFSYPSVWTYVLGAQKNRLIETVLLSTHNICFGREIRKLNFSYALITRERSGSVVEWLTRDREAAGLSLIGITALWSFSKAHLS